MCFKLLQDRKDISLAYPSWAYRAQEAKVIKFRLRRPFDLPRCQQGLINQQGSCWCRNGCRALEVEETMGNPYVSPGFACAFQAGVAILGQSMKVYELHRVAEHSVACLDGEIMQKLFAQHSVAFPKLRGT